MTRREWLDRAIAQTREWLDMVERDAEMELEFSRFGSEDYDFEVALTRHAGVARRTLEALEHERREAETIYGVGPA